ncbi:hypothetical protein, partial [Candidatus Darwinibacter acetoxidans]
TAFPVLLLIILKRYVDNPAILEMFGKLSYDKAELVFLAYSRDAQAQNAPYCSVSLRPRKDSAL